jgi:PAS domain S-box-containing protein
MALFAIVVGMTLFYCFRLLTLKSHQKFFESQAAALVIDNIFVSLLLFAAGPVITVYSGLFVITLIAATYWYRLRGMLISLIAQLAVITLTNTVAFYPPITLGLTRSMIVGLGLFIGVGFIVEQLTRNEHQERVLLSQMAEQNRLESSNLLALVNSMPDAVVLLDDDGKVQLANAAFGDLIQSEQSIVGQNIDKLLALHSPKKDSISLINLARSDEKTMRHRGLMAVSASGAEVGLEATITPNTLKDSTHHYIVLLKDVTNEKSLDEQRQEFISVASHELRTPLGIAEAALSTMLLGKKDMKPEAVTLAEQAQRNVIFLAALVKDITTLAEAQRDALTVEIKPLQVRPLVEQVYKDFLPVATNKGIVLKVQYLPDLPTVLTTEHHVHEIMENLVSNAIKYTKEGGVTITVRPTPAGGILFSIADSGIGISAANQSKLFTKFFRAEDYRTRETGGTGLGLYLCLELANRINAHIWAQSKLNHGSTFFLEIPPVSHLSRDSGQVVQAKVKSLVDQL